MTIDDTYIDSYFFTKKGTYLRSKLDTISEDMKAYLYKRYADSSDIEETIKRIHYKIDVHPKCPICGKPVKFIGKPSKMWQTYCSRSCLSKANVEKIEDKYGTRCTLTLDDVQEKKKETVMSKYGVGHNWAIPEVHNKCIETCKEKYGADYIRDVVIPKREETSKLKYGASHHMKTEHYKKLYGSTSYMKSGDVEKIREAQRKAYITKNANGTWCTSKIENSLHQYLDEHNILYKYQYKSDTYPWLCDFYFPEKDAYVEIQGNWTHGTHQYNSDDADDIRQVEIWEQKGSDYYKNAIKTWTVSDVAKRKHAEAANLNYVEIFSNDLDVCLDVLRKHNII